MTGIMLFYIRTGAFDVILCKKNSTFPASFVPRLADINLSSSTMDVLAHTGPAGLVQRRFAFYRRGFSVLN